MANPEEMEDRCEDTWLPVTMCGCKVHKKPEPKPVRRTHAMWNISPEMPVESRFVAQWSGDCGECGERFEAGDQCGFRDDVLIGPCCIEEE